MHWESRKKWECRRSLVWAQMTWCREFRSEFTHPSIKVEKDWDLDLQEHRLDRPWIYISIWASFTKFFLLSGDGKFECGTPGRMGPASQSLPAPCCCSYISVSSINAEVGSYTEQQKKNNPKKGAFSVYTEIWQAFTSVIMAAEAALAHSALVLAFLSWQCNCLWPNIDPEQRLKITLLSEYLEPDEFLDAANCTSPQEAGRLERGGGAGCWTWKSFRAPGCSIASQGRSAAFLPDQLLVSDSSNAFGFGYAVLSFLEMVIFWRYVSFRPCSPGEAEGAELLQLPLAELPAGGREREHQGPYQMGVAMGNCI